MPLVLPLAVIGLAMFLFLLVYAFRVTIGALLEAMAKQIPIIGGYIARALNDVFDWTLGKVQAFLKTKTLALVHWLIHLAQYVADPWEAVSAFSGALTNALDTLTHQTMPAFVGAVVGDIQRKVEIAIEWARGAQNTVNGLENTIGQRISAAVGVASAELVHGIDRLRVELNDAFSTRLTNGIDTLRREFNRDVTAVGLGIAAVGTDIAHDLTGAEEAIRSGLGDLGKQVRDAENAISSGRFSALAKALAGLAAFAALLARESGLANRECRGRVRGICDADGAAWDDLLAGLLGGVALLEFSEMVRVARGLAEELSGDIDDYLGRG